MIFLSVLRNRSLRRALLAYAAFNAAEWGTWVAMLVYAFGVGGSAAAGFVAIIQLVPSIIVAPLGSVLGDRMRRERALALGYLVQAASMAGVAAALLLDAPVPVVYGLAAVAASSMTLTRPVHHALLPSLSETPEELTAANAASSTVVGLSVFLGPLVTSLLLRTRGPGVVYAVFAVAVGLGALLALGIRAYESPTEIHEDVLRSAMAGVRELRRDRAAAVLVLLVGAQFVVVGLLDILAVDLAIDVLAMGRSGPGIFASAVGLGGLIGAAATVVLIGRRRLAPAFLIGALATGIPVMLIAGPVGVALVIVLLVISGVGGSFVDVSGRTLLQRTVREEVLARVFGLQEAVMMIALTIGSATAPILVAAFGGRDAFLVAGGLLPVFALLAWRPLATLDARAIVPGPELRLLRGISIFQFLEQPALERLAMSLIPIDAPAGTAVIREGDVGDRFYILVAGAAAVTNQGRLVADLGPGHYFGEIALLREVPRTATVVLTADSHLVALEREEFLGAVTGSRPSVAEADREIDRRLAELGSDE